MLLICKIHAEVILRLAFTQILLLIVALIVIVLISPHALATSTASEATKRTLLVNGVSREYLVYYPSERNLKRPVVFAFHGGFGSAESIMKKSKLHETRRGRDYIIVYPTGYRRSWNVGPCCGYAKKDNIDDLAFFDAMLLDIQKIANVDTSRVYVTGFSNGAMMTYHLACNRADKIAAIAPVGGAMQGDLEACRPSRAIPIMHIHGASDEWAPFLGGEGKRKQAGKQRPIPELIAFWYKKYSCAEEQAFSFAKDVNCTSFSQCAAGGSVTLCLVDGLGHQWPGHKPRYLMLKMLGAGKPEVKGSEEILKFFDRWSLDKIIEKEGK